MKKASKPKRVPAIVPRFIKNAVAIGAIPALSGCHPHSHPVVANYQRNAPVVAYFAPPTPVDATEATPPVQPVVAAMMPSPVVAAMVPHPPAPADAGVDAPAPKPAKKPAKAVKQPPPPRPDILGVAAMYAPDPNLELVPLRTETKKKP
jgi:hypothetical protein